MSVLTREIQQHWQAIQPMLVIRTEQDYDRAVKQLNVLIDEVGTNEQHPLYELLDTLGTVIHAYEETHYRLELASSVAVLQYLMEEHQLTQAELPEIGSQGVVSETLRGKRELNVRQIRALAKRFNVSPAIFF